MNKIPLLLGAALISAASLHAQTTIFEHSFDGSSATNLNGTAVDVGGENWIAVDGEITADGSTYGGSGAVLPHTFGSSIYEFTSTINLNPSATNLTGFASVYFTVGDPVVAGYINGQDVNAYGTFGLRANGDFELWGGLANSASANVDGGNLTDYGLTSADRTGTLRMVLDTTGASWTIAGYYTPEGKSEIQIDLSNTGSGLLYTFGANQPEGPITGAGIIFSQRSNVNGDEAVFQDFSLTQIPEPQTYALILGAVSLGLLTLRRRQK